MYGRVLYRVLTQRPDEGQIEAKASNKPVKRPYEPINLRYILRSEISGIWPWIWTLELTLELTLDLALALSQTGPKTGL